MAAAGFAELSRIFDDAPPASCLRVSFIDAGSADDALTDGVCTATSLLRQVLAPLTQVLNPVLKKLLNLLP